MAKRFGVVLLTLGCTLGSVSLGWAQGAFAGFSADAAGSGANLGLNPGIVGGGATIPGAIPLKITGEVKCVSCTLEELGLEDNPGDLYQFSQEQTHMVIQVTKGSPAMAWELIEGHKFFLAPGEKPDELKRLLSESKPGTQLEVTGGLAPEVKIFIPLFVHLK